jgi:hypothetical protein
VSDKLKPTAVATSSTDDVALVWGKTKSGGMNILRKRADRIEAGVVEPLKEGSPIHGEVVQLHARPNSPLYDVEVHVPRARELPLGTGSVSGPETSAAGAADSSTSGASSAALKRAASGGPPQVATDTYRKNWDSIYRSPAARKLLN